jgi:membrane protein YdbS with pleckstrin-like domain
MDRSGLIDHTTNELAPAMRLQDGEAIVAVFKRSGWLVLLNKVVTLGLFTFWWRACIFVVTDQRLYIREGILSKSELSLPMRFIQDAAMRRNLVGIGSVVVSTAGGSESDTMLSPLNGRDARALSDAIIAQAHSRWAETPEEA